jgi:hypothetical protein
MGRRTPERVTFGSVLAVGEFRALWAAELFSIAGDQLARVALALLCVLVATMTFLGGPFKAAQQALWSPRPFSLL